MNMNLGAQNINVVYFLCILLVATLSVGCGTLLVVTLPRAREVRHHARGHPARGVRPSAGWLLDSGSSFQGVSEICVLDQPLQDTRR